jgi:hypothetical protein
MPMRESKKPTPVFCGLCGKRLEVMSDPIDDFDIYTGEQRVDIVLQCPAQAAEAGGRLHSRWTAGDLWAHEFIVPDGMSASQTGGQR